MHRVRLLALSAGLLALAGGLSATKAQGPNGGYGTIKGQIVLPNPPALPPITVTADKAHCESKGALADTSVAVNKANNGVRYVVVWLRPDNANLKATFPQEKIKPELAKAAPKNHVIDQPCCQFEPRIVAARTGDTLEIKNSAIVNHNFNISSAAFSFNQNIPPGGDIKAPKALEAEGSLIPYACNIHPWMKGGLRVFDHPYFAVTDADGKFEIKDAPVGKWRIVVAHELGLHKGREGRLGTPIEVTGPVTQLPPVVLDVPAIGAMVNVKK